MANPLIWLSGAEPEILANFKHDRPKYIGTGGAVLFTSCIAAMSMAFAVHMALKAPVATAILCGLAWGTGILSLDRWLVSTMTRRQGLLLAVPRVMLALLFSVVISTPLTLQIFNSEIAQQMSLDHAAAAASFATSPDVAKLQAKVTADQATVKNYQGVISSGGTTAATSPAKDPAMSQLEAKLTADQNQVTYYRNAAHCEQYGGSGCTGVVGGNVVRGTGSAYTFDEQQLATYTQQVATDNQNIRAEQKTLAGNNKTDEAKAVSNAQTNLTRAQAQLTADTNALNNLKSDFDVNNTNNTGILARLKALDELRMHNFNLLVAELVLFLFFAAIELLPVLVKLLLNRGEETSYERAVAAADEVSVMREEHAQRAGYMEAVREQEQRIALSQAVYTGFTSNVRDELAKRQVEAYRKVELDKIERWERRGLRQNLRMDGDRPLRAMPLSRLRWLPGAKSWRSPVPRVVSSGPMRKAIDTGPLRKVPDGHAATITVRPPSGGYPPYGDGR
jgi:Domain of unknown function (DUF4407)